MSFYYYTPGTRGQRRGARGGVLRLRRIHRGARLRHDRPTVAEVSFLGQRLVAMKHVIGARGVDGFLRVAKGYAA